MKVNPSSHWLSKHQSPCLEVSRALLHCPGGRRDLGTNRAQAAHKAAALCSGLHPAAGGGGLKSEPAGEQASATPKGWHPPPTQIQNHGITEAPGP